LRTEGVPVRTARFTTPDSPEERTRDTKGGDHHAPERWPGLAERATAPWAHWWTAPAGEHRLADLVCAVECSAADAVGTRSHGDESPPKAGERGFFDRPREDGHQYVFVNAITPELARTDLVRCGWRPGEWSRRGSRLLA